MSSDKKNGKQSGASGAMFFDSYAILEILGENPRYEAYKECYPVLTKLNLFEIYEACLRTKDAETGARCIDALSGFVQDYPMDVLARAAAMRAAHKKRRLSMTDCIGYCFAQHLGIPFLTGDREFEGMENVEFVS